MTKYIQITKATSKSSWYANPDFIGAIFEVTPDPDTASRWQVEADKHSDCSRSIRKADCIEVALPTITEQKPELLTKDYLDSFLNLFANALLLQIQRKKVQNSSNGIAQFVMDYLHECDIPELQIIHRQNGAHLITTEQLKEIVEELEATSSLPAAATANDLRDAYPEVFAPAKTYTPSERIIHGDDELMLIRSGDTWNLLDVNTGLTRKVCLITESDTTALSKEQLQYLLAGTREEAMQAFNNYDSYLPNALKGGQP